MRIFLDTIDIFIMLNTQKLLYIFPDVAYIAELLATKKEYTFATQSFRQINGEFLDEEVLISKNVQKLFEKLEEKEEYHIILPDFVFTNTVINIESSSEANALEHVAKVLLPELEITPETHQIHTTVLTNFKGTCKVQISALEKSVSAPLRAIAKSSNVVVSAVSPLSWVAKSMISLEPSISILQVGARLYTAQQYIGVDQTADFPSDDYEAIGESVKTLRGAEPSIQTIYLVSNELVEEGIKEKLSNTLPTQQLTSIKDEDSKIPPHIKHIIEYSMKTLSISDFPVPKFKLEKASAEDLELLTTKNSDEALPEPSTLQHAKSTEYKEDERKTITLPTTMLPLPTVMSDDLDESTTESDSMEVNAETTDIDIDDEIDASTDKNALSATAEKEIDEPSSEEIEDLDLDNFDTDELDTDADSKSDNSLASTATKIPLDLDQKSVDDPEIDRDDLRTKAQPDTNEVDLSAFVSKPMSEEVTTTKEEILKTDGLHTSEKKVIKNSSGVGSMLRMIFIAIAVFFTTVAVGTGIGFGLINLSKEQPPEPTPIAQTPAPTPSATPTPTPEPEIDPTTLSVLIVNATTKAGYAGKIKTSLAETKFELVDTKNAVGEYEAGQDYILIKEENEQLKKLLEEATELTFEYSNDIATEDSKGTYDFVIVLAK